MPFWNFWVCWGILREALETSSEISSLPHSQNYHFYTHEPIKFVHFIFFASFSFCGVAHTVLISTKTFSRVSLMWQMWMTEEMVSHESICHTKLLFSFRRLGVWHTSLLDYFYVLFGAWQLQSQSSHPSSISCVPRMKKYRFGTTWGRVNDDRNFFFGWSISLILLLQSRIALFIHKFFFCFVFFQWRM